ncbi:YkvA family protein [Clostridium lacusfryxellense]|uniref:YkvA family protein n=1 Tax=Clostridium lacusfryxellense TaxID=205328 RepID=UPI001C0AB38E|nr:DUF1232 domain-containing protein [Clostridium lacusfryxellense]MBU3113649.1 DUF1232 domain-containing protein [Clostridium lacusfryxellense]
MKNNKQSDISKYAKDFTKSSFLKKIKRTAKTAGISVVYAGLLLYYTFQKATTPRWAKASIISSLGYFISPLDGIPDIIPALGYTDDLGVLVLAIGTVYMFIDDKVKKEAKEKVKDLFGKYDDSLLKNVDKRLIKEIK